jgi:hypothetical protein
MVRKLPATALKNYVEDGWKIAVDFRENDVYASRNGSSVYQGYPVCFLSIAMAKTFKRGES